MVNTSGGQLACEYGSAGPEQSLRWPMSLLGVDDGQFLVVDYYQHRVHLLTAGLQFVRHLVRRDDPADPGLTYSRHVAVDGDNLYVGTESGVIGVYRVRPAERQADDG